MYKNKHLQGVRFLAALHIENSLLLLRRTKLVHSFIFQSMLAVIHHPNITSSAIDQPS